MTYHWHDDEFDWCPCDESLEGRPIRESELRRKNQPVPRPRKASKRDPKPKGKAA